MRLIKTIFILKISVLTSCNVIKKETKGMKQDNNFKISYKFKTDIKTAFEMWTNSDCFSSWLGPDGAKMVFLTTNVVEGGSSLWTMTSLDGQTKYGQNNVKTIQPTDLLRYYPNLSDTEGKFLKAQSSTTQPAHRMTTKN